MEDTRPISPFSDSGGGLPTPVPFTNTGAQMRPPDNRDFTLGAFGIPPVIPTSFIQDISALEVYFQGQYPTCGAHAGATIASILQTQKNKKTTVLSPRYLWKQIKLIDNFAPDVGTDMRSIFKALVTVGDCTLDLMPDTIDSTLSAYTTPNDITDAQIVSGNLNSLQAYAFVDSPTVAQIKQAIFEHKAAILLLKIGDGWWTDSQGNLSYKESDIMPLKLGNSIGAHFVVAHSFDDKFIYFRNSFGKGWAKSGDGYFDNSYAPFVLSLGVALTLDVPFIFTKNLSLGMNSEAVRQLQIALNRLNFFVATTGVGSPGHETSFFGQKTFDALKRYQKAHGIPDTGFFGLLSRQAINNSL